MKRVTIVGPVDKRQIVYPLMHVLGFVGKTQLVTDDGNFRRFAPEYEKEFSIGINDVVVVRDVFEHLEERDRKGDYDFEVYVTTNEVVEDGEVVYCHGLHKSFALENAIDLIESQKGKEVIITASKVKDAEKGVVQMEISRETVSYVHGCEEHKEFMPCVNAGIGKVSAHLFSGFTGLSADEYMKVLKRVE